MSVDQQSAINDYICMTIENSLSFDQKVELFQRLIDLDLVDQIDPRFQNLAQNLIASGECTPKQEVEESEEECVNAY